MKKKPQHLEPEEVTKPYFVELPNGHLDLVGLRPGTISIRPELRLFFENYLRTGGAMPFYRIEALGYTDDKDCWVYSVRI